MASSPALHCATDSVPLPNGIRNFTDSQRHLPLTTVEKIRYASYGKPNKTIVFIGFVWFFLFFGTTQSVFQKSQNYDVVSTNYVVVSTNADVVYTNADVVLTTHPAFRFERTAFSHRENRFLFQREWLNDLTCFPLARWAGFAIQTQ